MRGTVPIVAVFALLSGCGLATSGLGAAGDAGGNVSVTTRSP